MENNQQIAQIASPYAPGYRFMPTDEELITEYLAKKVNNEPIPIDDICEVNLYEHTPFYLAANFPRLGDNDYYFFTPRDRKYPNGSRPNRAVGNHDGYWKATGADKAIVSKTGELIGGKKVLVYYIGKPRGAKTAIKTDWIMHEFRLNTPSKTPNKKDMRLDDWVLCRLKRKSGKGNKKQNDYEEEGVMKENVAIDNNNNNNNVENAMDQQNQGGGEMMMIEGGQNESQQSQPSYFQEIRFNQDVSNYYYDDPLLSLAGTSSEEQNGGIINFGDFNKGGVFDQFDEQFQEFVWGGGCYDGTLGIEGSGNGDINFPQQQCPPFDAPPPPFDAPPPGLDLKKFADEFVRDEKAELSKDDAERKK